MFERGIKNLKKEGNKFTFFVEMQSPHPQGISLMKMKTKQTQSLSQSPDFLPFEHVLQCLRAFFIALNKAKNNGISS